MFAGAGLTIESTVIGSSGNGVTPATDEIGIATGMGGLSGISGGSSPAMVNGFWPDH